jgi:hypothetical protein
MKKLKFLKNLDYLIYFFFKGKLLKIILLLITSRFLYNPNTLRKINGKITDISEINHLQIDTFLKLYLR